MKPTNIEDLYLLAGIAPPDIRRDVCARMEKKKQESKLQTTQPTSGGAVTAESSCCANCVEPLRGGPIYRFLGMPQPAMRTRWMAGAVAHKSG